MRYLFLLLVFISSASVASSGPKEVPLTPELAEKLGFSVKVTLEGPATMIELKGPHQSPSGCPASRSGSFLLDSSGEELFVYITELPKADLRPEALGYFTNKKHTMGVFIDYLCSDTRTSQGIRYSVPSISNWLITS